MLKKMAAVFLLGVLVPAIACLAQNIPTGRWWHMPRVVNRLGLSQRQVQQLDAAYHDSRLKLIELKSALEKERFELESLAEAETVDETVLMDQYRRMEKARVALGTERFRFFVKIRRIVGSQRFRQLLELRKKRLKARKRLRQPSGGSTQ